MSEGPGERYEDLVKKTDGIHKPESKGHLCQEGRVHWWLVSSFIHFLSALLAPHGCVSVLCTTFEASIQYPKSSLAMWLNLKQRRQKITQCCLDALSAARSWAESCVLRQRLAKWFPVPDAESVSVSIPPA